MNATGQSLHENKGISALAKQSVLIHAWLPPHNGVIKVKFPSDKQPHLKMLIHHKEEVLGKIDCVQLFASFRRKQIGITNYIQ